MNRKQKKLLLRIILSVLLIALALITEADGSLKLAFFVLAYLISAYDVLKKALTNIKNAQVFDENFLMSIASVGAFALAIYSKSGDYLEAVAVIVFYQTGELFESYAVDKSRKNIVSLMDIRPDYANIEQDGVIKKVDPDDVAVGDEIIVKIGEKIPIDGIVVSGKSALNTSALTGESLPRDVKEGDEVISGCINMNGMLRIKTTKEFGESAVSKILELVENSSSNKSKQENFVYKFASVYTPIVCGLALTLAVLPPVIRMGVLSLDPLWNQWIYRALTFLVISCPCAFVISIPLTFFASLGGASKDGILIKGSNYIEALSKVNHVVFDKTGSLTKGTFEVVDVHHNDMPKENLLHYVAYAEYASSHPIAESLKKAYGKEIDTQNVKNIKEISGQGITANVDGKNVAVGNDKLMQHLNIKSQSCHMDGTVVHTSIDDTYGGHIVVADTVKEDSGKAIDMLKQLGVKNITMLTGDIKGVSEKCAHVLGITDFYSELLPQDKVTKLERIINDNKKGSVVFVGDGINDAPSIMRADVGIAMGAMGSDAAIEAADVVLMDDSPVKVAKAIQIARKCMKIVYENTIFSIGIKICFLISGALGITGMGFAVFADVGVMILAVLNAVRAMKVPESV